MTTLLELNNITLTYGGPQPAVKNLSLEIREGEMLSLLGPSGCGKTTTMRAIAGLMTPASGRIALRGRDITRVPPNRRRFGLVFQSYALFPHMTAAQNIAFGLKVQRRTPREIDNRTGEMIELVGLRGFETRRPAELSGGQQQRVALARAIAVEPSLLLLDEPLSNLDARLRIEMRTQLSQLQRDLGITMIYVTHDQTEALALSDRIAVMREGVIEQLDTPRGIHDAPKTAFIANFMGYENIFDIEGEAMVGDNRQVLAPKGTPPGTAKLAWRPRSVRTGTGPYRAVVRGVAYLGEHTEYLLDGPLGPVKAEVPTTGKTFQAGQEISFDLPLSRAAVIGGSS
ncbi:Putrescine transport ATP-binding protein PotA (TC 3.A.1.11.1) [hydrothermal vent metagenome]|uniref:Putrescine transport ATP-binding protein PotA (TC 3.A.1.11.1) n=1 Tax=hydrothermal vent metagenome TaxID=652676 RepID=A0A3B0TJ92_9ZZZZ